MKYLSPLLVVGDGVGVATDSDAVPTTGAITAAEDVPQFWQDYIKTQVDNMDMLVILLSLIIGLLLCLILKRR